MHDIQSKISKFIDYTNHLKGDEKGEAQVFCDRLFQAFGHDGYKEAGATLEYRVKGKKSTRFADLLWGDRVLIEMKKRGSKLESHRAQVFDYWWKLRPNSPNYAILCNFDEFYIYDFTQQDEPLDRLTLARLPERYTALNFLFPQAKKPVFNNNLVDVTRKAAIKVAKVFNALVERGEDRMIAQRFVLQCVFTMFAEDFDLLPKDIFTSILRDLLHDETLSSYDLIGGLFKQMASEKPARGGRYQDVKYFNGGLFNEPEPVELIKKEVFLLIEAARENWGKVNPSIFGTIFQNSMGADARHEFGAHFTSELDIYKVVHPCIIQPWLRQIEKANQLGELRKLLREIRGYQVLDPACGSGNFLYVAFRELKRLEMEVLNKIYREFAAGRKEIGTTSLVSTTQFHGIDKNPFAVELARVTLLLGKEIAAKETRNWIDTDQLALDFQMESTLPLDNLDTNIIEADALFTEWPEVDVIIGNPPFQSKNKMQEEFGPAYVNQLHNAFPDVPGRADFCVYWFHKAHLVMKPNRFSGLVATNTIRENYSREGSLDFIVQNNGEIFNAVSSQDWSGDAAVNVSIVCWKKGRYKGEKILYVINSSGKLQAHSVSQIYSSLKTSTDVSTAKVLFQNKIPKCVFQGQTHGHKGFLLSKDNAQKILLEFPDYDQVLKPYLNGDEFVASYMSQPKRFVIDFSQLDIFEASNYKKVYSIIANDVLPEKKLKAEDQEEKNRVLLSKNPGARINKHHINFFKSWWKLSYGREDMLRSIRKLKRYIVCPQVSLRQIFDFVSPEINPNAGLMAFAFEDDYSFGVIHSSIHWEWWKAKCSTLEARLRYTTNTVWDTFPWPQSPTLDQIETVAKAAKTLRDERSTIMQKHKMSLRDLYRIIEQPGKNPIKDLHDQLDQAVLRAYGFDPKGDLLTQILELNQFLSAQEEIDNPVIGPGLPSWVEDKSQFISDDCVTFLG